MYYFARTEFENYFQTALVKKTNTKDKSMIQQIRIAR